MIFPIIIIETAQHLRIETGNHFKQHAYCLLCQAAHSSQLAKYSSRMLESRMIAMVTQHIATQRVI
jgi:hypothetical protein